MALQQELADYENILVVYVKNGKWEKTQTVPTAEFLDSITEVMGESKTRLFGDLAWTCKSTFMFGKAMYCKITTHTEYGIDSMDLSVDAFISSDPAILNEYKPDDHRSRKERRANPQV